MNIKEIARQAGVSIATVSHVVNKTRYVSPELTEKVLSVINGSEGKPTYVLRDIKAAKSKVILCFIDQVENPFYGNVIKGIKLKAAQNGYQVAVVNSSSKGLFNEYIRLEKPCGIIVITDKNDLKLKELNIPTVVIGHSDNELPEGNVIINPHECAYRGTHHLIKNGHDRIGFIYEEESRHSHQMLQGYKDALNDNGIPFEPSFAVGVNAGQSFDNNLIEAVFMNGNRPTAFLSTDVKTTIVALKFFNSNNIKCPNDVSLVSLKKFELSDMLQPAITTVAQDPLEIGMKSLEKLNQKITGANGGTANTVVPSRLTVRDSTQSLGRGPRGERAESPEALYLSPSDMELVKAGSYTAAISFHYSGTAWAKLHEKGIKDVFSELGVKVLAVTDAHFDPEFQNKQHASIQALNPDVLISIPTDEILTAPSYKELGESGVKLVFINHVPQGFEREDYVTCISVNERENGQTAGRMLGEYLKANGNKKIGLLMHGAQFFTTKQRDLAVEQVLIEEFPEFEIVAVKEFHHEKNVFDTCYEMIKSHPEIEGLYVSWEGPALAALNALRELNRLDIGVVTADLDSEVAMNIASGGPIKGVSSQRPYEQGRAMALSAALALIGKSVPSFIGVTPYKVTQDNLLAGWQDVLKERPPLQLVNALKNHKKP